MLKYFPDEMAMARVAAKLLKKLLDGNVTALLVQLETNGASRPDSERAATLLATLVTDSSMSDVIAKTGGVMKAVASLDMLSSKLATEQIVRMIARLADNKANVTDIIKSGAVSKMESLLADSATDVGLASQAIECLTRVGLTSNNLDLVKNAVAPTIATLERCIEDASAVEKVRARDCEGLAAIPFSRSLTCVFLVVCAPYQALIFLDSVTMLGVDDDESYVESIVAAMRANAESATIQTLGLRTLSRLARVEKTALFLTENGTIRQALQTIAHNSSDEAAIAALELLTTLCLTDAGASETAKQSGFEVIVDVMYAHPESDEVSTHLHRLRGVRIPLSLRHLCSLSQARAAALKLIGQLSSQDLIDQHVSRLRSLSEKFACASISEAEAAELPRLAMALGVLTTVPSNIQRIALAGGIEPMVALMSTLASIEDDMTEEPTRRSGKVSQPSCLQSCTLTNFSALCSAFCRSQSVSLEDSKHSRRAADHKNPLPSHRAD